MHAIAWKLSFALDPKTSSLDDPAACRTLARTVLECGGPFGLVAFRAGTDQLRAIIEGDGGSAQDFARHLRICLSHRMEMGSDFQSVRVSALNTPAQLRWQLMNILRSAPPGGEDPLCEASNLPDLLGHRLIGRSTRLRLRRLLPEFDPVALTNILPVRLTADDRIDENLLPDAAAAVVCVPHLGLSSRDAMLGRAALQIARVSLRTKGGRGPVAPQRAVVQLMDSRHGQQLVEGVLRQARLMSAWASRKRPAPGAKRRLRGRHAGVTLD